MPDPQPQQQPTPPEQKDYSFPGAGPDVGTAGEVASLASPALEEAIPLLGTIIGAGMMGYHGAKAMNAADAGNSEEADKNADEMTGDAINMIPLVGLARALM